MANYMISYVKRHTVDLTPQKAMASPSVGSGLETWLPLANQIVYISDVLIFKAGRSMRKADEFSLGPERERTPQPANKASGDGPQIPIGGRREEGLHGRPPAQDQEREATGSGGN
eukprot:7652554-Pyramimonas_sp.AAC.1